MPTHIGIGLFTGQVPPGSGRTIAEEYADTLALGRLAEEVGFDSVWVSEHHGASDGYLPSLLPMLAALAAVTDRVQLGTGVLLVPFHDPLRLAEDAAVVDQISNGRLILGLGLGWREEEFRMWGVPVGERLRRTTETVEVLRRAWTGERFTFEGRHFRYDRVLVTPAPARPGGPPVYLGGFAEPAVRRAGRLGDGYIRSRSGLEGSRRSLTWAEDGARAAGKDPASLGFALLQNAFVARGEDAWALVRDAAAHQLGTYEGWRLEGDTPDGTMRVVPPDEATLRALTPAGEPEQVLAALTPIVEAFGGRRELHLIVRLHYPGMGRETSARAIELFAGAVLPELRAAAATAERGLDTEPASE
ncbi:MAG: LLM class flavin-dependent oxidoreductase [Actinomycetota bacterium]|nr:LLM class flavin-dependent oxidoreductase [Actinomycetota bacterium]